MSLEDESSRRVAEKLASTIDFSLPLSVERLLRNDPEPVSRYDAATITAVASLVVSAASLAWTIFRDLKNDGRKDAEKLSRQAFAQAVASQARARLRTPERVKQPVFELVVEAIVEDVWSAAEADNPPALGD